MEKRVYYLDGTAACFQKMVAEWCNYHLDEAAAERFKELIEAVTKLTIPEKDGVETIDNFNIKEFFEKELSQDITTELSDIINPSSFNDFIYEYHRTIMLKKYIIIRLILFIVNYCGHLAPLQEVAGVAVVRMLAKVLNKKVR